MVLVVVVVGAGVVVVVVVVPEDDVIATGSICEEMSLWLCFRSPRLAVALNQLIAC